MLNWNHNSEELYIFRPDVLARVQTFKQVNRAMSTLVFVGGETKMKNKRLFQHCYTAMFVISSITPIASSEIQGDRELLMRVIEAH